MCSVQNHLYCAISKKRFLPIPAIVQNRKSINPKIRSATPGLRGTNNHCTCIDFHQCVCATRFADVEAIWLIGRCMLFCTWRSIKIPPVYIKRNVCIPLPKILWKSKQCKHVKYSNHIQRRAKIINGNYVPQWKKQFDDVILFPLIPTWCSATDFTFWNLNKKISEWYYIAGSLRYDSQNYLSMTIICMYRLNKYKNMMTSSNGNIFRVTGPLCGEFTGPGEIPAQGQWRGALMFSLTWARINGWENNREAGYLSRHGGHYDVNVMNGFIKNIFHL